MTVARSALHVAWEFHVEPKERDAERFHAEGERLMDELLKLEQCTPEMLDPAVSTEYDRDVVLVELVVVGKPYVGALDTALAVVRTAIHAIGGGTPDWPSPEAFVPDRMEFSAGALRSEPVRVPTHT